MKLHKMWIEGSYPFKVRFSGLQVSNLEKVSNPSETTRHFL